jgi:hypothetical protein
LLALSAAAREQVFMNMNSGHVKSLDNDAEGAGNIQNNSGLGKRGFNFGGTETLSSEVISVLENCS